MFEKWRLMTITKNVEGGEAQTIDVYDTKKKVYEKFYDKCSQLGGNTSVARFEVCIINPDGGIEKKETYKIEDFE